MKTYNKLKEISAVLFHEIKFSGNLNLLDKDYSEEKQYSQDQIIELNKSWVKMYDEYFERTDDPRFRKELRNKNKKLKLNLKIVNIQRILGVLIDFNQVKNHLDIDASKSIINTLGEGLNKLHNNIKFDANKSIDEQIKKIESVLGGLQSRSKVMFKDDLQVQDQDIMMFYRIKSNAEDVLGRNLDENVNMLQWIAYIKDRDNKISALKNKK